MKNTTARAERNPAEAPPPLTFDGLLTTEQAARYLSMSERWLQGETAAGRIRCVRLRQPGKARGAVRYRREALDAYIASCDSNSRDPSSTS